MEAIFPHICVSLEVNSGNIKVGISANLSVSLLSQNSLCTFRHCGHFSIRASMGRQSILSAFVSWPPKPSQIPPAPHSCTSSFASLAGIQKENIGFGDSHDRWDNSFENNSLRLSSPLFLWKGRYLVCSFDCVGHGVPFAALQFCCCLAKLVRTKNWASDPTLFQNYPNLQKRGWEGFGCQVADSS